ncbi:MAG: hypothetical protein PHI12_08915 [Dehalococcoidales bacterium]|nr:hypothetical protein [Dehalococcoidales bacterium]
MANQIVITIEGVDVTADVELREFIVEDPLDGEKTATAVIEP